MDLSHLPSIKCIIEWYLIENSEIKTMEMVIATGIITREDKREMITNSTDRARQKLLVESSETCTDSS